MDRRGFLGSNASLAADVSLVVGIVVALLLTLGVILAVRRHYTAHRWVQTAAVTANIVQVLLIMLGSFQRSAEPGIPQRLNQPFYLVATVHAAIGTLALLFGAFVALRGNELVPRVLKFNNYKLFMRSAYGLYMLATALGVWVYITWYAAAPVIAAAQPEASTAANEPNAQAVAQTATQTVPMADFVFQPAALVIPAGTTVEWINQDGAPHTATADDGTAFKSATLGNGERFAFRFDTPGEFAYYCELHGSPGGIGMAGTISVVEPGQAAQQAAIAAPPATPPGGQAPTPLPLPAQLFTQPSGTAAFRDRQTFGDALEIDVLLGDAPAQSPLAAFLVSASGDRVQPIGQLQRNGERAQLLYLAPNGEQLAGRFARLVITDDAPAAVQPGGRTIWEASLPPEAFAQLGRLLGGAGTPGPVVLLRQQTDELARHIGLLAQGQAANDLPGVRRHAEHVYNLVAGSRDARFGDLDGDGRSQNPGDGFGLLSNGEQAGYIGATREAALAAATAPDAGDSIATHGRHVAVCADNLRAWAEEARGLALEISQANNTTEAGAAVARLQTLGGWIQRGQDVDGDGLLVPVPGEGGGLVAYEHAMYMSGFGLVRAAP